MPHDTSLITTIVMGLILAFVGGFVASRLKLPPLVGYLLAGVAVGPFTPGFVSDADLAEQLAEIGVILLMFGIGLHFSLKDLLSVRRIAIPGAIAQIIVAALLGSGLAHLWGWTSGAGLVFGLALSVASTVVLLRALEHHNTLDSINGRIAIGWLIVEDLVMVLALVLLPALAGALGGNASESQATVETIALALLFTLGKVALFLALVLVVGTRVVPWVLEHVARTGSRELFTLSVLATALGIAYESASLFGVSFALGAFFAGVVLSESDFSYQAAADSLPLQDAFAVLFFVSVGMLFDPAVLLRNPLSVVAVLATILIGKSVAAFVIVLVLGYPVRTALTVSASLAQIGEFSFILIGLGVTLGLVPAEGRDLVLAGALLSIMLNPAVFTAFDGLERWLRRHPRILTLLERDGGQTLSTLPEESLDDGPHDHAIIVGYGRVGRVVGKTLSDESLPLIVVDKDRRRVEALRAQGVRAIFGEASTPGILPAAGISRARLLVIATPDGFQTRRIIGIARELNPGIDIAVRTQSDAEVAHLENEGVGLAIMGARELSFGLAEYALRSLGISRRRAEEIIQKERISGEGGAFERRPDLSAREAPELRLRREDDDGTV